MTSAAATVVCTSCGATNGYDARYCRACGERLAAAPSGSETRKVVTVLFSDLAGSTALGDALDPESLRQLMTRYFATMGAVVRRHGGTTEKFIGDAIMAVFGVPQLHEDDAVRALRAALAMRDALAELNDEFERVWHIRIHSRIGINTGEVIAGDPRHGQSFVVGDAVNVAARLEQSAEPGEVLVGEGTYRMARDVATLEPLPPLQVKGKTEPLAAWRLVDVADDGQLGRRLESPLIGRQRELALLESAYRRSVDEQSCELVTVMGPAGVGKSRLTHELLPRLGSETTVLSGRCLPYGEGITFWPLIEILRSAAKLGEADSAEEARAKLGELVDGPDASLVCTRLAALLGLADVTPGVQETFWAVRKLFDALAAKRPLVVVFDDIHWAEPTLLDLVEYLAGSLQGGAVLLVCSARSELLEVRGDWMAAKPNASLVVLRALDTKETGGLIRNLLGGARLADSAQAQIAGAAEGNPLFVEETLRMLVDDGVLEARDGTWEVTGDLSELTIPPTINAVLTARLDRLDEDERAVLERAAVIGRVFWWGAVADLSPADLRPRVGSLLQALARKELITPERSEVRDEDAYRFTHILIGDAAYRTIPKRIRADLHERFAVWMETKFERGDRAGAYGEIVGYHLEQAYEALSELGPVDSRMIELGRRGAAVLAAAGRRAFARGDMSAAVNLLQRAIALAPADDPERSKLLPDLAFALLETGDLARTREVIGAAQAAAVASGDRRLQAYAEILALWERWFTDPEGWADEASREAERAIAVFEELGDERGVAKGWWLLGLLNLTRCNFGAAEVAWEKASDHARAAGDHRERLESLSWVPLVVWAGATPVDDAIRRCEDVVRRADGDQKATAAALFSWANLEAMRGRFDDARRLVADARAALEEVGLTVWVAGPLTEMNGWIELWAGAPDVAERELRWGVLTLRRMGELAWLPTIAGILAESLYVQGRDGEALETLDVGAETAGSDDAYSQGLLRSVRGKVLSRRAAHAEAEALVREAVGICDQTDFLFLRSFVYAALAEVLERGGAVDEARAAAAEAARLADAKGLTVASVPLHRAS